MMVAHGFQYMLNPMWRELLATPLRYTNLANTYRGDEDVENRSMSYLCNSHLYMVFSTIHRGVRFNYI